MLSSAGANPLALCTARKKPSDDRPPCLENPRPEEAESTLTENVASPFHAEPRQGDLPTRTNSPLRGSSCVWPLDSQVPRETYHPTTRILKRIAGARAESACHRR